MVMNRHAAAQSRTVTLERWPVSGGRHGLRLMQGGKHVRWTEGCAQVWAVAYADDDEVIQAMREMAKRQRFTHMRIAGDWTLRAKPRGGRLH